MAPKPQVRRSPIAALLYGAPIGLLGGLIGLGGAEFRLPILAGVFGYAAHRAVALNLAISLVTVVSALLIRGGTLSLAPVLCLLPVALAMIVGAVCAAFVGVGLVRRISDSQGPCTEPRGRGILRSSRRTSEGGIMLVVERVRTRLDRAGWKKGS
jgi:uncharacterized membrane protein YfcA